MTTYNDVIDELGVFTFDVEDYLPMAGGREMLQTIFNKRDWDTSVKEFQEIVSEVRNDAEVSFRDQMFIGEMETMEEEFEDVVRGTSAADGLDDDEIEEIVSDLEPGDIVFENYESVIDEDVKFYISPFQRENFNTACNEMYTFLEGFTEAYNDEEVTSFDGDVPEVIEKLFASQGYSVDDALDADKLSCSKFLDSFVDEVGNGVSNPSLTLLVSLHSSAIFDIIDGDNRTLVVPTDAVVGFYDGVNGGGSLIGIELEKPWEVPVSVEDLASTFGGWFIEDGDSYTPDGVYGGLRYVEVDM